MGKSDFNKPGNGFKDEMGRRYSQLTVVGRYTPKFRRARWLCRCDCGNLTATYGENLRAGRTTSCGCRRGSNLRVDNMQKTHGMSYTKIHRAWVNMRYRCLNPRSREYPKYGGRGITICDRWSDFENFYEDMGTTYKPGLSIDRIDNDGGYSKANCRWATNFQQSNNTRKTIYLTYGGVRKPLGEWAKDIGIDAHVLNSRRRRGLPVERILEAPI